MDQLTKFVTYCFTILYQHQVADSYDHAKEAAGKVKVAYDLKSVGPPVLSAKDAMERNSMFPVHFAVVGETKPIGDLVEGFAEGEMKLEDVQVHYLQTIFSAFLRHEFQYS